MLTRIPRAIVAVQAFVMVNGDPHYAQFDVKRYRHWTLRVSDRQSYLGKAVVWLEREGDMQRLSSLTKDEQIELWDRVLPEYERALENLWKPDHMNYGWLGNLFALHKGHGHMHLIPRYASSREFGGHVFVDTEWGKHYKVDSRENTPLPLVMAVRDVLRAEIPDALSV